VELCSQKALDLQKMKIEIADDKILVGCLELAQLPCRGAA
jgi:hypothetical protein